MEKEEVKLQRDTCEKCIALKGKVNSLGEQIYCSQAHAHELSTIRKSKMVSNLKKDIFDMVYQWGRANVVVDENAPAYKELVDRLEETYY